MAKKKAQSVTPNVIESDNWAETLKAWGAKPGEMLIVFLSRKNETEFIG